MLSLGSSWSTYWDHVADAVSAEQTLMREAIDAGRGVLGICFGAQQLAAVLGGSVARAPHPEIGWHRVDAGNGASGIPGSEVLVGEWLQWHYDSVTLPEGIEPLAVSTVGPQAFTAGRCVGVQFHPEATEEAPPQHGPVFEVDAAYEGPALFLAGGASDYVQPHHQAEIERLFPAAETEIVDGAGHWLHAEKPEPVTERLRAFLNG